MVHHFQALLAPSCASTALTPSPQGRVGVDTPSEKAETYFSVWRALILWLDVAAAAAAANDAVANWQPGRVCCMPAGLGPDPVFP